MRTLRATVPSAEVSAFVGEPLELEGVVGFPGFLAVELQAGECGEEAKEGREEEVEEDDGAADCKSEGEGEDGEGVVV